VTPTSTVGRFRRWFWRPPRPHGELIIDRRVSPLELLYDLVYVAVIGQASHHLAADVTGRAILEFAIVFSLIWIAWINGSLYIELHGQEDGRTRSLVFVQMGILAVLAVFAGEAAGAGGRGFALVYSAFLAFVTLLWFLVRQQDVIERPAFVRGTTRYTAVIAILAVVTFASAFVETDVRLGIWVVCIVGWTFLLVYQGLQPGGIERAIVPTDSLVERFGLFTIIVLGEVVLGVVTGLSGADRDFKTIATGMLALGIGFGFWWVYFDIVGGRFPKGDGRSLVNWTLSHLPVTMAITAGGAASVSLIAHAHDASAPPDTALLLGGAVALGLLAEIPLTRALADDVRLRAVFQPLRVAMAVGAAVALLAGLAHPKPLVLALILGAVLTLLWFYAVCRFLRSDAWAETREGPSKAA
jgi:low temperature requirement protein LtrA